MLIFLEFWVGVVSLMILLFFAVQLPKFSRMSERLYQTLNNRLEADVHLIENASSPALRKHYDFVPRLVETWSNLNDVAKQVALG